MNAMIRHAAMACTLCTIAQFTAADVLMRVPVGGASEKPVELEASRTTTTHLLPPTGHIGYVEKRLVDTVEVTVSGPGDEKTRIWLKAAVA